MMGQPTGTQPDEASQRKAKVYTELASPFGIVKPLVVARLTLMNVTWHSMRIWFAML